MSKKKMTKILKDMDYGCEKRGVNMKEKEIELAIRIPEDIYEEVMSGDWSNFAPYGFCKAIENGTPIPKGHGDLVDRNNYLKEIEDDIVGNYPDLTDWIKDTQAIIPADKEGSEEQK